jgi:soluble lytic murein transglycosylase-like protein
MTCIYPSPLFNQRIGACWLSVLLVLTALTTPVSATTTAFERVAIRDCIEQAAARYRLSPVLLLAIAQQESGLNPRAINRNTNGSTDMGVMQINTLWLPTLQRHGIEAPDLWEPCTNIMVGAWILRNNFQRWGETLTGLGAYNASSQDKRLRYAVRLLKRVQQLQPAHEPRM